MPPHPQVVPYSLPLSKYNPPRGSAPSGEKLWPVSNTPAAEYSYTVPQPLDWPPTYVVPNRSPIGSKTGVPAGPIPSFGVTDLPAKLCSRVNVPSGVSSNSVPSPFAPPLYATPKKLPLEFWTNPPIGPIPSGPVKV